MASAGCCSPTRTMPYCTSASYSLPEAYASLPPRVPRYSWSTRIASTQSRSHEAATNSSTETVVIFFGDGEASAAEVSPDAVAVEETLPAVSVGAPEPPDADRAGDAMDVRLALSGGAGVVAITVATAASVARLPRSTNRCLTATARAVDNAVRIRFNHSGARTSRAEALHTITGTASLLPFANAVG